MSTLETKKAEATLMGALYVARLLAEHMDGAKGGPAWRDAFRDDVLKQIRSEFIADAISIDDEPALYDAAFAGVIAALAYRVDE